MVITVEIYKEIRQKALEGMSQRRIAAVLGISRNTVKKYLNGETVPWERKAYSDREATVLTKEVCAFIGKCLEEDQQEGTPKKQRHTARRIYERLVDERQFTGSESTVRAYVHELREKTAEAYVPLGFRRGEAVQIDWGECQIWLAGERTKVNLFCARLCYSAVPFVVAYRRQNSESFLEALVKTFEYFGGVPKRVIFDNGKVGVKDGFGAHAVAQDSYAALAAHYCFEPVFCNLAAGHEKGLVEGLVGFSRRNFCTPMPKVESMDELNNMLETRCIKYLNHRVEGKKADVGTLLAEEQPALRPLPGYKFDPARRTEGKVNAFCTVRYETNNYSVPVKYCGKTVTIKVLPEKIEVYYKGECIASHPRCFARHENIYRMEHYLPLLERKGRAIFQARPVQDNVPDQFLSWLERQELAPKELVALLERSLEIGFEAVMRGEPVPVQPPAMAIQDPVSVHDVDLSAYDNHFLGSREEVRQ